MEVGLRPIGKPLELPPTPIATALRFYSTKWYPKMLICWRVITGFSNGIANTRYGIAVMLEKVLRFTDSIVDFQRFLKCSA